MKKALLVSFIILPVLGGGLYFYNKIPKVKLFINKDKSGYLEVNNKIVSEFKSGEGVVFTTWNRYEISASGTTYRIKKHGKQLESSENITEYFGGTQLISIIRP